MSETDDEALIKELSEDFGLAPKPGGRSALEQRILAGFEEIHRFVEKQGRLPENAPDRDIFERIYAVRLERIRSSEACLNIAKAEDKLGILSTYKKAPIVDSQQVSDLDLQAELRDLAADTELTQLVHVRSTFEREAAEDIAQRQPCREFSQFRSFFDTIQRELKSGVRRTVEFEHDGGFAKGDLFILSGQLALVAEVDEKLTKSYRREDRRLRVIFDNGTESNLWLRSLQRALYKDPRNRRILQIDELAGSLFATNISPSDRVTGQIYVLRSQSNHPFVAANRNVVHKIGSTSTPLNSRLSQSEKDPTFLRAKVELVTTYQLANVDPRAMESLIHDFLASVRLDVVVTDRFGDHVEPREWFLVPLSAIDELVNRFIDGSICDYRYDAVSARLVKTI